MCRDTPLKLEAERDGPAAGGCPRRAFLARSISSSVARSSGSVAWSKASLSLPQVLCMRRQDIFLVAAISFWARRAYVCACLWSVSPTLASESAELGGVERRTCKMTMSWSARASANCVCSSEISLMWRGLTPSALLRSRRMATYSHCKFQ